MVRSEWLQLSDEAGRLETEVHRLDVQLMKAARNPSISHIEFLAIAERTDATRRDLWDVWAQMRGIRETVET